MATGINETDGVAFFFVSTECVTTSYTVSSPDHCDSPQSQDSLHTRPRQLFGPNH